MNTNDTIFAIENELTNDGAMYMLDELTSKLVDMTPVPPVDEEKEQSFYAF